MNYVYKNITTSDSTMLLKGTNREFTILNKVQIANVSGSDSTVDLYIEAIDVNQTEKLHGSKENGNYNESTDDFATKESKIYYQIKGVIVPVGVTLILFADSPCTYYGHYDLRIVASEGIDVSVSYEYKGRELEVAPDGIIQNPY